MHKIKIVTEEKNILQVISSMPLEASIIDLTDSRMGGDRPICSCAEYHRPHYHENHIPVVTFEQSKAGQLNFKPK